jgi:hypothetical protein
VGATVNGINFGALAQSAAAQADLLTIYAAMISRLSSAVPVRSALGGQTLTPGVYSCSSYCTLDDVLTFDAQNDPTAVFQIITEGYLAVDPGARMVLLNGARSNHIFWTLGTCTQILLLQ